MLTPLAWITAVPVPTAVTGIAMPGALLPSQMKMPVGWIVTTPGLLDVRFTITPVDHGLSDDGSSGACVVSCSVRDVWLPTPAMVAFCVIHTTVAVTLISSGADVS